MCGRACKQKCSTEQCRLHSNTVRRRETVVIPSKQLGKCMSVCSMHIAQTETQLHVHLLLLLGCNLNLFHFSSSRRNSVFHIRNDNPHNIHQMVAVCAVWVLCVSLLCLYVSFIWFGCATALLEVDGSTLHSFHSSVRSIFLRQNSFRRENFFHSLGT